MHPLNKHYVLPIVIIFIEIIEETIYYKPNVSKQYLRQKILNLLWRSMQNACWLFVTICGIHDSLVNFSISTAYQFCRMLNYLFSETKKNGQLRGKKSIQVSEGNIKLIDRLLHVYLIRIFSSCIYKIKLFRLAKLGNSWYTF